MDHIPDEFKDYMVTRSHLSHAEQEERFTGMHMREIEERATMLCNLRFDKESVKDRIKRYIVWAFELFELPSFYKSVDSVVDRVYKRLGR